MPRQTTGLLLALLMMVGLVSCRSSANDPAAADEATTTPEIEWQSFESHVFTRATADNRLVLLSLGTQWCHWCHVMDDETWSDEVVRRLLHKGFICTRADADARVDLAQRYENYGWPATVIFAPDGEELVKLRGYIPPLRMRSLLEAVIDDPTPGPSIVVEPEITPGSETTLSAEVRAELESRLREAWDDEHAGWGTVHKYLPWQNVEYLLWRALAGDADAGAKAVRILEAQLQLLDPVWGGVYQYSDGGVWTNPNYEKLLQFQAENLRIYALAFAQFGDDRWLQAGESILRYMREFLRDDATGAFYVSQDADVVKGEHSAGFFALDDAGRRAQGVPAVDRSLYARENGWAIRGLCAWYAATGDESALEDAVKAAEWVERERCVRFSAPVTAAGTLIGPLVGHGSRLAPQVSAATELYFADSLQVGVAMSDLFDATGDARWRRLAAEMAAACRMFESDKAGYAIVNTNADAQGALCQFDDNVTAARWLFRLPLMATHDEILSNLPVLGLLFRESGFTGGWQQAMRWLCTPAVATQRRLTVGALLLADNEVRTGLMGISITGDPADPAAQALHKAALALPVPRRVIVYIKPGSDDERAHFDKPTIIVCYNGVCSMPITEPDDLRDAALGLLY